MADFDSENGDDALALALAAGRTFREAADAAGVSESTLYRRWRETDFRQRVAQIQGEMISRALGRVADSMASAADTLRSLLQAEAETVRLGAARALLELGPRLRETVELEQRIAALEQRTGGAKP